VNQSVASGWAGVEDLCAQPEQASRQTLDRRPPHPPTIFVFLSGGQAISTGAVYKGYMHNPHSNTCKGCKPTPTCVKDASSTQTLIFSSWTAHLILSVCLPGRAPSRYAVAGCFSGLADDLVGGISVFFYALLTGRAFQVF
jgi:hypothetical protein